MRTILMSCRFIIVLCLLGTGILIAESSFDISYDGRHPGAEIQSGQDSNIQKTSIVPRSLDHINIILVLLCTGMIGFFGVRRHRYTLNNYVRAKQPENKKFDETLVCSSNLAGQDCRDQSENPDKCELGLPCLV